MLGTSNSLYEFLEVTGDAISVSLPYLLMLPANVILLALHRSESGKAQVCEENPASHPAKLEITNSYSWKYDNCIQNYSLFSECTYPHFWMFHCSWKFHFTTFISQKKKKKINLWGCICCFIRFLICHWREWIDEKDNYYSCNNILI